MKKTGAFSTTSEITLSWLIRMRWLAVLGQIITVWISSQHLQISIPLRPIGILIGIAALSNLAVQIWRSRFAEKAAVFLVGLLMLDTFLLTGLLYFSGGPINPFSVFYLVHVALASVTLRRPWSWVVAMLSIGGFGLLFLTQGSVAAAHHDISLHLRGMWIAFALAAVLIAYLAGGLFSELQNREAQLASLRAETEKRERLLSVATLAAGAAHELNTPLGTIAVAVKELEAVWASAPEEVRDDLRLIRSQIERCRLIVQQMGSYGALEENVEARSKTALGDFLQQVLSTLPESERQRVVLDVDDSRGHFCLPVQSLQRVLLNLLKNALDASSEMESVILRTHPLKDTLIFQVEDSGKGMSAEILAHAFEPFYTTKEPGKGMGLGLFISRFLSEKMGGRLDLISAPSSGTRAILSVPLEVA